MEKYNVLYYVDAINHIIIFLFIHIHASEVEKVEE